MAEIQHFTQKSLETLLPKEKAYLVRDDEVTGLVVKVYPTGLKTFFLNVRVGRTVDMFKIGLWPDLNVAMVREKAKKMRADLAMGKNPKAEKKEGVTLGEFSRFIWIATETGRNPQRNTALFTVSIWRPGRITC